MTDASGSTGEPLSVTEGLVSTIILIGTRSPWSSSRSSGSSDRRRSTASTSRVAVPDGKGGVAFGAVASVLGALSFSYFLSLPSTL
jgi:hypothetical protein